MNNLCADEPHTCSAVSLPNDVLATPVFGPTIDFSLVRKGLILCRNGKLSSSCVHSWNCDVLKLRRVESRSRSYVTVSNCDSNNAVFFRHDKHKDALLSNPCIISRRWEYQMCLPTITCHARTVTLEYQWSLFMPPMAEISFGHDYGPPKTPYVLYNRGFSRAQVCLRIMRCDFRGCASLFMICVSTVQICGRQRISLLFFLYMLM